MAAMPGKLVTTSQGVTWRDQISQGMVRKRERVLRRVFRDTYATTCHKKRTSIDFIVL